MEMQGAAGSARPDLRLPDFRWCHANSRSGSKPEIQAEARPLSPQCQEDSQIHA